MTQQLRAAGALTAAIAAVLVIGLPLMILLMLDPSSQAACSGTPTGPGPTSVPGIPTNLLPIFEGAAQQFQLGNDGWAYLAALNNAESTFGTSQLPGVHSGSNSAGAAGPMQIGIGGAATDNWDTIVGADPAQPARRHAATERLQRDRRRLRRRGAAEEMGGARELAGGARGVEQLPARDRPSHTARRAIHQHRPSGRPARPRSPRRRRRRSRRAGRDACPSAARRRQALWLGSCRTGWRRSRRARRRRCRR